MYNYMDTCIHFSIDMIIENIYREREGHSSPYLLILVAMTEPDTNKIKTKRTYRFYMQCKYPATFLVLVNERSMASSNINQVTIIFYLLNTLLFVLVLGWLSLISGSIATINFRLSFQPSRNTYLYTNNKRNYLCYTGHRSCAHP